MSCQDALRVESSVAWCFGESSIYGAGEKSSHYLPGPCLSAYGTFVSSDTEYIVFTRGSAGERAKACACAIWGFLKMLHCTGVFSHESFLGSQQYSTATSSQFPSWRNENASLPGPPPCTPGQRGPDFKILKQQTLRVLVTAP